MPRGGDGIHEPEAHLEICIGQPTFLVKPHLSLKGDDQGLDELGCDLISFPEHEIGARLRLVTGDQRQAFEGIRNPVAVAASTLVQKFGNVFSCGFGEWGVGRCERASQSRLRSERVPFEGRGDLLIVLLEAEDALGDLVEEKWAGVSVLRLRMEKWISIRFIQLACVGRCTRVRLSNRPWRRFDGSPAAMDRAAVDDPEDAPGGPVGFTCHHPGDEVVEGGDGDLGDDVAEEPGAVDVPGRDVGADAVAAVLVLDPHGAARTRRRDRMAAGADRDLRLFLGADDELAPAEGAPVPLPVIEIEGRVPPWARTRDRAGRSSSAGSRGAGHRHGATAGWWCR